MQLERVRPFGFAFPHIKDKAKAKAKVSGNRSTGNAAYRTALQAISYYDNVYNSVISLLFTVSQKTPAAFQEQIKINMRTGKRTVTKPRQDEELIPFSTI